MSKNVPCYFSAHPPLGDKFHHVVPKTPEQKPKSSVVWQREELHIARLAGAYNHPKDSSTEDEMPIESKGRLLQDGEGRFCEINPAFNPDAPRPRTFPTHALLVYLGDSATLSFLRSIRRLVKTQLGPSPFTMDASRHSILDLTMSRLGTVQHSYTLPDQETSQCLIDSFFANARPQFVFDSQFHQANRPADCRSLRPL